jgi:trans-aconitate methyltransferase
MFMSSIHIWKPELYDEKLGYVSNFGMEVVELLNPKKGERILDIGCGTGDLSNEIAKLGADVIGMDVSTEMVEKARKKYPQVHFIFGSGEDFNFDTKFDAIFSNAALHWMNNVKVVECLWNNLNKGGRFVAEFGGKGNIELIINAITNVLNQKLGIEAKKFNPWYFPSIGEYSNLLEEQGFQVSYAIHFERPTKMEDGESGLNHWLTGLADDFFRSIDESTKKDLFKIIENELREDLFQNGAWYVDYKRIRIMAIKP